MKNSNDTIGDRTRDLPACSAALTNYPYHQRVRNAGIPTYSLNHRTNGKDYGLKLGGDRFEHRLKLWLTLLSFCPVSFCVSS